MADQLSKLHWSEHALANAGVTITPAFVNEALKEYWAKFSNGLVGHAKVHTMLGNGIPRTEGALVGFFEEYSGVKDIHRGPTDPVTGPARSVDIFLRNKETGKLLLSLEAVSISNGRTGWFASECIDLFLPGKRDIEVFLLGAGPVAESVVLHLDYRAYDRIKRIAVLSRSESNQQLVKKLQSVVRVTLEAVNGRDLLPKADFVITATNAKKPVVAANELRPNAVTLSLGIDEWPEEYFDHLLREDGLFVVDDMVSVEERNVHVLSLYYSRKGQKLTQQGKDDGVKNFIDVLRKTLQSGRPVHMSPVGLASLDLAVAAQIYKTLAKLFKPTINGNLPSPTMSPTVPNRIWRLKTGMQRHGIDVLICFKPEHSFYLTAFNPSIYSHPVIGILTTNSAKPILLVNTLRKEKGDSTPGHRVMYNYGTWFGTHTAGETWQEAIKNILAHEGRNVGIEEEISAFHRDELQIVLPGASFSYATTLIQECRNIKDEDEIASARIAAELCNAGMAAAEVSLIGVSTEQHAVAAAWNAMYELWATKYGSFDINEFGSLEGGDFYSFKPWVLAGRRRFLMVDKPIAGPIRNEAVSVLIWTSINGMHAELERTIFVGDVSSAQREAVTRVKVIRAEIFAMLKLGVPLNELYRTACAHLAAHGYTLPGRIGHGIGLGAHEHLSLDAATQVELAPGMILTIEPNVQVPSQNVATQLSDTVVITETGYEFLAPYVDITA